MKVRAAAVLLLLLLSLGTTAVLPASACGCGAFIAPDAQVVTETSLIRLQGGRETIVMKLGVKGVTPDAAWVMPVPSQAEVTLADPAVFEALEDATAPRTEYVDKWWPSFTVMGAGASEGAAGGGVQVLEQLQVGPFDVVRLQAADSQAIAQWLADNGFRLEPEVAEGLSYYAGMGWEVVAAKLTPDGAQGLGDGELPPLQLTFDTTQPVYPMRLSQGATDTQGVRLYVLADHRYEVTSAPAPGMTAELRFAGRVSGHPALEPYLDGGTDYLTEFGQTFYDPGQIEGDYQLAQAADDGSYQRVEYVTRDRWPVTMAIIGAVSTLLAAGALWLGWRSTTRRRPAR